MQKRLDRKLEQQSIVVAKDGGSTHSYAFRVLDKEIKDMREEIDAMTMKLDKNLQFINDIHKSKAKVRALVMSSGVDYEFR